MNKVEGLRELLSVTKKNLQLVERQIEVLQQGRVAVEPAQDVSTEHRAAWFGAVDDYDGLDGINLGPYGDATQFGLAPRTQHTGTIRVQEDAAFVCTDVLVALAQAEDGTLFNFFEDPYASSSSCPPFLRLTDGNTGRPLVVGSTEGPLDKDRGAVPLTYFSSMRAGLGSNIKNRLFSEFTIPRAGTVKAEAFDLSSFSEGALNNFRVYVTLLGFKVYGA